MQPQQAQKVIKIDVDPVLEMAECTICMCRQQEPTITRCGHTFCRPCISEQVNRLHKCPLCNATINSVEQDCIRNFQVEEIVKSLVDTKEKETKKYFDELANNAIQDEGKKLGGEGSALETIFALKLRESLLSF